MNHYLAHTMYRAFRSSLRSMRMLLRCVPILEVLFTGVLLLLSTSRNTAQSEKPQNASNSASTIQTPNEAAVGDAARGKELFVKNGCYECHGYFGQGGSYSGVKLAPDPLPWQAIAAFIRNPPGLNPAALTDSMMPPYSSKLVPDKDVQDIYAYLKSMPAGTDVKNVPSYKK